jgi:hypothetical protein
MKQAIINFHQDEERDWVAQLKCGHFQHVRHNPPWMIRQWVISIAGRNEMLGHKLNCKKCDLGEPKDLLPF